MLKYDPAVMLLKSDDQQYIKSPETWHIDIPQLATDCTVLINDKNLFLGDEESFFEHNIATIKEEVIQSLQDNHLQLFNSLDPQASSELLQYIYGELDKILKFDYIGWITPLLLTQGYNRAEAINELTIQRDRERALRNWRKPSL